MAEREAVNVSAIIVTRGDVDILPVIGSLPTEWEVLVWDNHEQCCAKITTDSSKYDVIPGTDLGVYGRYAAIAYASHDIIFTQDDDCILKNPANVVAAYEPGVVTYNMPYAFRDGGVDSVMVGFGACFHRDLPQQAFDRYEIAHGYHSVHNSDVFNRTCDVVFTTLSPTKMMHEPLTLLDCSYADNRMWRQPGHNEERRRMQQLATAVKEQSSAVA